jgi:hypothetical protein
MASDHQGKPQRSISRIDEASHAAFSSMQFAVQVREPWGCEYVTRASTLSHFIRE